MKKLILITGLLIINSCGPQYPKEQSSQDPENQRIFHKGNIKIEEIVNLESGINIYVLKYHNYYHRIFVAVNDSGGISLISFP